MHIAFITVGDTARLTGGYLYHARVFAGLPSHGIQVTEVVASGASLAQQLAAAASFGIQFDPRPFDVLVVDALARAVCAPWLDAWRAQRPLVAMVHELPSIANNSPDEQEREAPLLRADRLIAVSRHGQHLLEQRGVPPERIRVVSGGCDGAGVFIAEDAESAEKKTETSMPSVPSVANILCVAQWIPRKGIASLVRAWGGQPRPGALLELIGEADADAAYAAEVRAALAAAHPAAPVLVHGPVSDAALTAAYRRASLFALPSRYEGYGIVYAEALRHGLPVLACDVGPVPELVGGAGLLVPPDDDTALAAALSRLLTDAELRMRLSAAARARAASLPTWDDAVAGFAGVLKELSIEH
ncbi:MAG: glycosyltransferase family 4 protein [Chloroflexaceae bacterium]|jgi:glycosyltransferase involved in cell wall biosynthesis|nr:glycosyltransferase family 4 protein [Chloroflexaceae bacterium]